MGIQCCCCRFCNFRESLVCHPKDPVSKGNWIGWRHVLVNGCRFNKSINFTNKNSKKSTKFLISYHIISYHRSNFTSLLHNLALKMSMDSMVPSEAPEPILPMPAECQSSSFLSFWSCHTSNSILLDRLATCHLRYWVSVRR